MHKTKRSLQRDAIRSGLLPMAQLTQSKSMLETVLERSVYVASRFVYVEERPEWKREIQYIHSNHLENFGFTSPSTKSVHYVNSF